MNGVKIVIRYEITKPHYSPIFSPRKEVTIIHE